MSTNALAHLLGGRQRRSRGIKPALTALIVAFGLVGWGCGSLDLGSSSGPETFLDSDDYRDGEEIVGELLTDADYGRMVEDLSRRGVDFDWGWVDAAAGTPSEPLELAFDLTGYGTITVEPVRNASRQVAPGLVEEVRSSLQEAFRLAGLEVLDEGGAITVEAAVVDYKSDKTYAYVAMIDPFVEIELRMIERATARPLLLVRHQEHGTTPVLAAADFASELALFLR